MRAARVSAMASTPRTTPNRPPSWGGVDLRPEPPLLEDDDTLPVLMQKLCR